MTPQILEAFVSELEKIAGPDAAVYKLFAPLRNAAMNARTPGELAGIRNQLSVLNRTGGGLTAPASPAFKDAVREANRPKNMPSYFKETLKRAQKIPPPAAESMGYRSANKVS